MDKNFTEEFEETVGYELWLELIKDDPNYRY